MKLPVYQSVYRQWNEVTLQDHKDCSGTTWEHLWTEHLRVCHVPDARYPERLTEELCGLYENTPTYILFPPGWRQGWFLTLVLEPVSFRILWTSAPANVPARISTSFERDHFNRGHVISGGCCIMHKVFVWVFLFYCVFHAILCFLSKLMTHPLMSMKKNPAMFWFQVGIRFSSLGPIYFWLKSSKWFTNYCTNQAGTPFLLVEKGSPWFTRSGTKSLIETQNSNVYCHVHICGEGAVKWGTATPTTV